MNKKIIFFVITSSIIFGALGSLLLTRLIIPKLAAIPFFVRHNIAPAPGPLVINTTQEVRVTDGTDTIAAVQRVKPWTVAILSKDSTGTVQAIGSGALLTSDGLIATTKTVITGQSQIWVKNIDGTTVAATVVANDPSSDLVFIQAALTNQPSVAFGNSDILQLGERILVISQSSGQNQIESHVTYVASLPQDIPANTIFSSDTLYKTLGISSSMSPLSAVPNQTPEGGIVAASDGTVVGIYSKTGIILVDTIQSALNSYFNNNKQIVRGAIGFHYIYITPEISAITGIHEGLLVKRPDPKTLAIAIGSPAQQSGIQEGDLIYSVNGTQINYNHSFESLVSSAAPNSILTLELLRGGKDNVVTVIVKQK